MADLAGRTIAITGAARGIGRATAAAAARAGMRVAIGDLDAEVSERAAAEVGGGAIGLPLDVRDRDGFAAFLDAAEERLGPLEVLVNNAGIYHLGEVAHEEPAQTERQVAINLVAVVHGSRLALDRFLPRGRGHLVNVASSAGLVAVPGAATYSATKHGVVGFTRALRAELRGSGVRTTIVMPGVVNTDMVRGYAMPPGVRTVEPEAVAAAIVAALGTGRAEVVVPRETTVLARLINLLPPRPSDALQRALGLDRIMLAADRAEHRSYEQRFEDETA